MSHPRRLPRVEPDPELLAMFEQLDRIPVAVRRQAEFFIFFADTIFPLLETYRERLAPLYCANNGRPAWDPVRLLAVLILQFVLRVTDRQAAEAVQYDQRWRLSLHMDQQDVAFDPSLLVVFRDRLVNSKTEALAFEAVLDYLVEQGWVPKRSRQRLDSTHVRGLLSAMNLLDCARETIRLLLEDVEADGRCRRHGPPTGSSMSKARLIHAPKPRHWKRRPHRPARICWRSGRTQQGVGPS